MTMVLSAPPRVRIRLDGRELDEITARSLETVVVRQQASRPTVCELTFVPPEGPLRDEPTKGGTALTIGLADEPTPLFEGTVLSTERSYDARGAVTVRLRGVDVLGRLARRSPVRCHVDVSAIELARELCGAFDVEVVADDDGPRWRRLLQHRRSDLALMSDMLDRAGLAFALEGSQLHVFGPAGRPEEPVRLGLGEALLAATVEQRPADAAHRVEVAGWDALRAIPIDAHAGDETDLLAEMLDEVENAPTLTSAAVSTEAQALAAAEAELGRRRAVALRWSGTTVGNTALAPGRRVALDGVGGTGAEPDDVTLGTVIHHITAREGYTCRFESLAADPSGVARPVEAPLVALGAVCSVDDPDGLGRVQVELPALGDLESDWMGVLAPGAGNGAGLMTIPAVGDRVLVLLSSPLLAHGVVLGGLHGPDALPDWEDGRGAPQRFSLVTPGGHRVRLDDGAERLLIESEAGSLIEMTRSVVRVHAESELRLEAPGHRVVISGRAIDFEEA